MIVARAVARDDDLLSGDEIRQTLAAGLSGEYSGQKVLVLIPDRTRTLPLPQLFRMLVELLHDTKKVDFMVALGTHPPLSEEQLRRLVGISTGDPRNGFVGPC